MDKFLNGASIGRDRKARPLLAAGGGRSRNLALPGHIGIAAQENGFIDDLKWNLQRHKGQDVAGKSSIHLGREKIYHEIRH